LAASLKIRLTVCKVKEIRLLASNRSSTKSPHIVSHQCPVGVSTCWCECSQRRAVWWLLHLFTPAQFIDRFYYIFPPVFINDKVETSHKSGLRIIGARLSPFD